MQVLEAGEFQALCEGPDGVRAIDLRLVGPQAPGTWLLVFIDAAREVIDAERAALIRDALFAVSSALDGATDLDLWFPDLANREPQLPDFLKPQG
jgi:hydrogenase expression/formation protein HypC